MKKLAAMCVALLTAGLIVVGTGPAATAYPEWVCTITVDRQAIRPGDSFTVTGDSKFVDTAARSTADPISWTFTWNGETKLRTGAVASASFTAPEVASTRTITLTAVNQGSGDCERSIAMTVIGPAVAGPTSGGVLPSTGGPGLWALAGGLVLLAGGGTLILRSRRQHRAH